MVQCIISDTRVNTIDKLRFEELANLKNEHHQTFLDVFSLHLGGYHGGCRCILVLLRGLRPPHFVAARPGDRVRRMRFWRLITRGLRALVCIALGTRALPSKARSPDPITMPYGTWTRQKLPRVPTAPWRKKPRQTSRAPTISGVVIGSGDRALGRKARDSSPYARHASHPRA